MLAEQIAIKDVQALKGIVESRAKVAKALKQKTQQFRSDNFLRSHIGSRLHLVIQYADLVGFTHKSMVLPLEKLTTIWQIFAQEMNIVVANNHGYILKCAYFPVERRPVCQVGKLMCYEYVTNYTWNKSTCNMPFDT